MTSTRDPATENPAIGKDVEANGIRTNYLEAGSGDRHVVLVHGSGPGVTAYANWRGVLPVLGEQFHVVAPDMVGFGYSERPKDVTYRLDTWADQTVAVMDALGIGKAHLVGNSFGGAIALRLTTRHPDRVDKLVLMGSVGVAFPITEGLDAVWGYDGTLEGMKKIMGYFAYDKSLTTGDLAQARFEGATQPGFQEAFSSMFPAPRQRWVDSMVAPEDDQPPDPRLLPRRVGPAPTCHAVPLEARARHPRSPNRRTACATSLVRLYAPASRAGTCCGRP